MIIKKMTLSDFSQNTRIIYTEKSNEAILIDPGSEVDVINEFIDYKKLNITHCFLTHSHIDHAGAVKPLMDIHNFTLYAHNKGKEVRSSIESLSQIYGLNPISYRNCPEPDVYIEDNDELEFLDYKFKVIFTPGHAPGHVCFLEESEKVLIAGDLLFKGSVGRTDLPLSNKSDMKKSLKKLLLLDPENVVLSGHGEDTDLKTEFKTNPYLLDLDII